MAWCWVLDLQTFSPTTRWDRETSDNLKYRTQT